jgi:hypothetical protein
MPVGILGLCKRLQATTTSSVDISASFLRHMTYNWSAVLYVFNPLKPTGYVMHQQFNIQQLYVLPTLYLCVLYLSENKKLLVPLTA